MIVHPHNIGKMGALSSGFSIAKGNKIFFMDSDFQETPFDIPKLLDAMDGDVGLVIGWRQYREDNFIRKAVSRSYNLLTLFLFGINLHDSDCGFKILKKEVAKELKIKHKELVFDLELLVKTKKMGWKIKEVPIRHFRREGGKSAVNIKRLSRGLFLFFVIRLETLF